jgi:hypothetical protein
MICEYISMYPPPHMHVSSSSYDRSFDTRCFWWSASILVCILLLICMYPPPHMTGALTPAASDDLRVY